MIGDATYETLADAVAKADNGATIKLLKDVAMDSTLVLNKDTTLDLNGHKITNGSSLKTADYVIKITKEANVSIVGNKEGSDIADARNNKTGTITAISKMCIRDRSSSPPHRWRSSFRSGRRSRR